MADTRVLPRRLRTVSMREAYVLRAEAGWHLWKEELSMLPRDLSAPRKGRLRIARVQPSVEYGALKLRMDARVITVRSKRKCRHCLRYIADGTEVVAFTVGRARNRAFIHAEGCL